MLESHVTTVTPNSLFGLPDAPCKDDGVIDEWVSLAGEEESFGEACEEALGGDDGREEEVGCEVWAIVRADVEYYHGTHHLWGEYAVIEV